VAQVEAVSHYTQNSGEENYKDLDSHEEKDSMFENVTRGWSLRGGKEKKVVRGMVKGASKDMTREELAMYMKTWGGSENRLDK